jgi:glycosyltransferase involved in cell wall biosynthesis
MKIVNISYTDKGGAGTAVVRTHRRLLELGYDSILYLASDRKKKNTLIRRIVNRFKNYFKKLTGISATKENSIEISDYAAKYCFYSASELEKISITSILKNIDNGDIVLLYWLGHKMMNTSNFVQLSKKRKIKLIWYALDMAPITGGCHYFWECNGYQNQCFNCPALPDESKSLAHYQFLCKRENLQKVAIKLICSSHTGMNIFENAALKFESYSVLPFAFDTRIFDVQTLDSNKFAQGFSIFFNAQNIHDTRKGWSYFKQVIFLLDQLLTSTEHVDNVSILSVAYETHLPHFEKLKKIKLVNKGGYANGDNELATLYQSSNVLICTSIEDLTPLMVNEALLCGTPVIGFNNASNAEYIIDNLNGNLVKPLDVIEMSKILFKVINGEIIYASSQDIRNTVVNLHEPINWKKRFTEAILNN